MKWLIIKGSVFKNTEGYTMAAIPLLTDWPQGDVRSSSWNTALEFKFIFIELSIIMSFLTYPSCFIT